MNFLGRFSLSHVGVMQINRKQFFLRTKARKNFLWFVSCNFSKFWFFLKDSIFTNIVVDDTCHIMHIIFLRICSLVHRFFWIFIPYINTKYSYVYGYVLFLNGSKNSNSEVHNSKKWKEKRKFHASCNLGL